ncbi:hypothetical protein VULLAG_LOCUS5387 [Vulpes lagopus]
MAAQPPNKASVRSEGCEEQQVSVERRTLVLGEEACLHGHPHRAPRAEGGAVGSLAPGPGRRLMEGSSPGHRALLSRRRAASSPGPGYAVRCPVAQVCSGIALLLQLEAV